MESQEKLLHQLDSLDSLRGIVKTMKALSAANIKQYEAAALSLDHYAENIELGLGVAARALQEEERQSRQSVEPPRALVLFGSDHGLCGHFNENILALLETELEQTQQQPRLMAVGLRTAMLLEDQGLNVDEVLMAPASVEQITQSVQQVLLTLDQWRTRHRVQRIDLLYNTETTDNRQESRLQPLLPLDMTRFQSPQDKPWPSHKLPSFSLEARQLFGDLLQQYFFVSLFRACVQSQTVEHNTRLRTMYHAEQNIDRRHEEITADYRRTRQARITSELMEVVSGFDATRNDTSA